MKVTTLSIFGLISVYTIVRYVVFKGVDAEFIPLYLFNKVLALASVVFIAISYLLGPLHAFDPQMFETKLSLRRPFGLLGFACASIHSLISIILLTPYYYPALYMGGHFTLYASLHLLFGILAMLVFAIVAISSIPNVMQTTKAAEWRSIQRLGYLAYIFVLVHVYTVGVNSWKDYTVWPGGLVPISLIAFNIIVFGLLIKITSIMKRAPK